MLKHVKANRDILLLLILCVPGSECWDAYRWQISWGDEWGAIPACHVVL